MLRNIAQICNKRVVHHLCKLSSQNSIVENQTTKAIDYDIIDSRIIPTDDSVHYKNRESSVLEKCQEDISHVAPFLKPSFNFAAYVNKSETLQYLVKLGVELYKLEKDEEVPPYLLGLNFKKDVQNHILFLTDLGFKADDLGPFITKNPLIFKEDLENLEVRINYLKSKKFNDQMILRIIRDNSKWLSFSTQDIDKRLGYFQNNFSLTGDEVRQLTVKKPKLITYDLNHIKLNTFVIKEEMGFTTEETKHILLDTPKLFMHDQHKILKSFEYIHRKMNIPLETIVQMPRVLTYREFRIKQRHLFLEKLKKIQFDPKQPNYISLMDIVSGSDSHFATEIADSSIQTFNLFLKTL